MWPSRPWFDMIVSVLYRQQQLLRLPFLSCSLPFPPNFAILMNNKFILVDGNVRANV